MSIYWMAKPYEITKGMTNQEGAKPKKHNNVLQNTKSKLPWWVEILFVQIGLPENLLREILKLKSNSSKHFRNNRKRYYFSAIAIAAFGRKYFNLFAILRTTVLLHKVRVVALVNISHFKSIFRIKKYTIEHKDCIRNGNIILLFWLYLRN